MASTVHRATHSHIKWTLNGDHCCSRDPKEPGCTAASDLIEYRRERLDVCCAKQRSAVPGGMTSPRRGVKVVVRNSPQGNGLLLNFG